MELQKQPNRWSCLPTAFAIALDIKVSTLVEYVGHDGSDIAFPDYDDPYCRRSFHIQEMYDVCLQYYDAGVTPIEVDPTGYIDNGRCINVDLGGWARMCKYLEDKVGVFTGTSYSGKPHAVAWDGSIVFDPNGSLYKFDRKLFKIETFYILNLT